MVNGEITIEQYLESPEKYVAIDVRSPGEFEDSAIPLAINIPIFSNEEREVVGTIYKKESQNAAKWKAMEFVSPKLPTLLGAIRDIESQGKTPLLYCWRGGMRSRSMTMFATISGLNVRRLVGGYRAYREGIIKRLPSLYPKKAIVLYGMTGTGKTELLHLLKDKGYPVLDLEAYANHKGSLFGEINGNGKKGYNQKTFDALLFEDLIQIEGSPYFLMEGESKRIGKAVQPPELLSLKETGIHLHIESSLEKRVERIYEEYVSGREEEEEFHSQVDHALMLVLKRIGNNEVSQGLQKAWKEKDYLTLIRILINDYYDPRYTNKNKEYIKEETIICSDNMQQAVQEIIAFLEERNLKPLKGKTMNPER